MKTTLVLAALLAAAPLAASAAPLSYTFVEGGYNKVHVDVDGDAGEASGAYLKGSYDIGSGINAIGSIKRVNDSGSFDASHYDSHITQSELGLGYHQSMSDRVDFIAELAWNRFDVTAKVDGETVGDGQGTGGRGAVGVRGAFNDKFEASLKANYYDGNDFDGTWTATVGAQYLITPMWGVTAEIEHGDLIGEASTTRYMIGARASF